MQKVQIGKRVQPILYEGIIFRFSCGIIGYKSGDCDLPKENVTEQAPVSVSKENVNGSDYGPWMLVSKDKNKVQESRRGRSKSRKGRRSKSTVRGSQKAVRRVWREKENLSNLENSKITDPDLPSILGPIPDPSCALGKDSPFFLS